MYDVWIPLLPFAAFFAWLFLFGFTRPKMCSNCNHPLLSVQSPFRKSRRQWLLGGYYCHRCGCESDIRGRRVTARVDS